MLRYIGIDAHRESCTLAILGSNGRRLGSRCVETSGPALRAALKEIPGEKHVCLEEGEYSEWLYEICEPLAARVAVVQPEKPRGSKSDAIDAWSRADELRRGTLPKLIYKPAGRYRELREAVRCYQPVVADVVRVKNRLRSIFRSRGIQAVAEELDAPSCRAGWIERLPTASRLRAKILGDELDHLADVREAAEKWLLHVANGTAAVRLLATAPGIGPIRAAQIVAAVVSPHRFRTKRQFWSFCGLAVVTHSSSDWVKDEREGWIRKNATQTRGLNRNRHPMLKAVFKGAAITVIQHMPNSPLTQHYRQLLEAGTKPNLARLTIARSIAAAVLAMWKHEQEYDPSYTDERTPHR